MTAAFVIGSDTDLRNIERVRALPFFSEAARAFTAAVSQTLLGTASLRKYPELAALGFWLRPSHVAAMQASHPQSGEHFLRLPKGIAFHIAPGNVDTIFVYSWFISLLCGNLNVIRLSSRTSPAQEAIIDVLVNGLSQREHAAIRDRSIVLRYARDDMLTGRLSELAGVRIVWGGDSTIRAIRSIPMKACAAEVVFPDRTGLFVIATEPFLAASAGEQADVARLFSLDSYVFGQAACSSPRAVVWLGHSGTAEAQKIFWPLVCGMAARQAHGITGADVIQKQVAAARLAIHEHALEIKRHDPLVTRVVGPPAGLLSASALSLHCGNGLFYETFVQTINELLQALPPSLQTITYWGVSGQMLADDIASTVPAGVLRVVPVGSALEFSHVWDGLDLFESLTRRVDIR
jgi:hypothetical protein